MQESVSKGSAEVGGASASLHVRRLSPAIGAEVLDLDVSSALNDATFAAIRAVWLEHCVMLFRKVEMGDLAQVHFGERFGTLAHTLHHYESGRAHPAIMYVTNERKDGQPVGALPDGEMYFHSDMCYLEQPCMATVLYAIDVPSEGGETLFANTYAAYDTLSAEWKERLAGLRAVNTYEAGTADYAMTAMRRQRSPSARWYEHPVVRTHPETGRKALFVNRLMTEAIVGIPRGESDDLLTFLFDHQEQPQFVYEHRWMPGDLVIWDNRCTLHARRDFSPLERRTLRRVTVQGDRPV